YELAFRMQTAIPDVMRLEEEDPATQALYGLDQDRTRTFGRQCLAARRLAERGVRFVQVFHGSNGGAGPWDAQGDLKNGHTGLRPRKLTIPGRKRLEIDYGEPIRPIIA